VLTRAHPAGAGPIIGLPTDAGPPLDGPHTPRLAVLPRLADAVGRAVCTTAAPFVAGLLTARFVGPLTPGHPGVFVALLFVCGAFAVRGDHPWAGVAPGTGMLILAAAGPTLAIVLLATAVATGIGPPLSPEQLGVTWIAAACAALAPVELIRLWREARHPVRLAVIGPPAAATVLQWDIEASGDGRFTVVGRIADRDPEPPDLAAAVPTLGTLEHIDTLVVAHRLQILLVATPAARRGTFDRLLNSHLPLGVRAGALDDFYEHVFGHVPIYRIDGSWFESILRFDRRRDSRVAKRALDVVLALLVGLTLAPVLVVLALLIRRDGGPALFKQVRIGEGGQPFVMYKLRTMRSEPLPAEACWAAPNDPRTTRVGRLVRRSHLDEAPQVFNVLRGDMSFVGPRPEQPELVARLEGQFPFYQRRHLITPGITGWAQIRCGYAGTEAGAFWKLCHDLYYVRHHSPLFDLMILFQTLQSLNDDGRERAWLHAVHLEPPTGLRLAVTDDD
jgi:exopolysaccharide biosynthesis polyprenyl glycosylphosphotransferase